MLVDHHCHLDFPDLVTLREGVLARAKAAGVGLLVTVCTRVKRFAEVVAIAETYPQVYCTVGTHPHHAHEELDITTEHLVRFAKHKKVVAIGEAGLDYHYDMSPREAQEQGFRTHIAAARITGLPLVIHAREADERVGQILIEEMAKGKFTAVLHCYTSGMDLAKLGVGLGLYVSFSGVLTFKKSDDLRAIAAFVPMDRLLVETDAPYLAPEPFRGRKPNEPSLVVHTANALAKVKGITSAELATITTDNFHRLYSKVPRLVAVSAD